MIWMIIIFLVGYLVITLEHSLHINKAATALLAGVLCWTVYVLQVPDSELVAEQLTHHVSEIASILFFLLGAMTIVEIIDAHDGFELIVSRIRTDSSRKLLWIMAILAFVLSGILDNLTTTIVLVSLLRKLVDDKYERWLYACVVVIAANAGGAFTPIGDVTTTMLWIGGQITPQNVIAKLFLPSLVCMLFPLLYLSRTSGKKIQQNPRSEEEVTLKSTPLERKVVLALGVMVLVFVPVFKLVTHLPPYMGILLGLGFLWTVIEIIHHRKDEDLKTHFSVLMALRKVDTSTVLFFLGILLCVGALQSAGQLAIVADYLDSNVGNFYVINLLVGVFSSIVDNVPLVAAMMRMYGLDYPTDHTFWEFLAYCAGTGGSILIIGSAAGVAAMGIEKINFMWYVRRVSFLALMGYVAGAITFVIQHEIITHGLSADRLADLTTGLQTLFAIF
jgi:Na+/H+ antiporter NhaD/arsenite permease-like protein